MLKAALWFLCPYLVLKALQYFVVPSPGFGKAEPSTRERLLRGRTQDVPQGNGAGERPLEKRLTTDSDLT